MGNNFGYASKIAVGGIVIIVVALLVINARLTKEIHGNSNPLEVKSVPSAVKEDPSLLKKAAEEPKLVDLPPESIQEKASAPALNSSTSSEKDKKIIYELPLDDVILVQ